MGISKCDRNVMNKTMTNGLMLGMQVKQIYLTEILPSSSSSSASKISAQQHEYSMKQKKPKGKPIRTTVSTGFPFHLLINVDLALK